MAGMQSMPSGKGGKDIRLFLGIFISVSVFLCCRVLPVMAHGTDAAVIEKRTLCVAFTYDDGEPISYAKVTVDAPESDLPFQSSATDRNGIVCFAPDKVGQWQVTVNDGMGHQQQLPVAVDDKVDSSAAAAAPTAAPQAATAGRDKVGGVLAGIGVILSLAGGIALFQARRREKKPFVSSMMLF